MVILELFFKIKLSQMSPDTISWIGFSIILAVLYVIPIILYFSYQQLLLILLF